jgi:hypothetical protein
MIIPDKAVSIIRMQRSNYGKKDNIKHIKKMYNEDIEKEFNQIINLFPDNYKLEKIVDIGCGLAGVSLQLSHYYRYPKLYLIDKNEISDKIIYGYHENDSFYNSFELLREIIEMNYIENTYFILPETSFEKIKINNVDLVISLLACGFHFPLYFYIGKIIYCLKKTGIFVCDIRKEKYKQEIKIINIYFKEHFEIKTDNPKTIRICAKGKICPE